MSIEKKNIAVLISGSGSNLQAIIDACESGQINGRISVVISNRPNVLGLERAANSGIATQVIDHKQFASREAFDAELIKRIDAEHTDLVVLAGFMRILSDDFTHHYQGKLLNIHPSLLPDYKGTQTHQRALDDGVTEHGVSVHFVSPELDGGPVIMQAKIPVLKDDTADELAKRVLIKEHIIYPTVIEWFCADRLSLDNNTIQLDQQALSEPVILE
uniref:Phosphoribosylglycinamide formyltransferase n=1 Tax=uncultured Thiotrichaceae bacterium TaxID=298394 RepID=A0A6S6TX93_9GAMM|nr:MAG: Phosphoribosylglycinamide formyltransferase (EC [uncultured Thiotrichaceae bacterium]